jgi:hypothetical protein
MIDFGTVKAITIPEGKVAKITQGSTVLWQAEPENEPIINLIDTVGYTDGNRLSTSGGGLRGNTGTFVTGMIHLEAVGDVYRTSGVSFDADKNSNCGVWIYQSNQTYWTYLNTNRSKSPISHGTVGIEIDADGNLVITAGADFNNRWIRLCGIGSGANLIVTKNQEIT